MEVNLQHVNKGRNSTSVTCSVYNNKFTTMNTLGNESTFGLRIKARLPLEFIS